jgi:hypothetical protein
MEYQIEDGRRSSTYCHGFVKWPAYKVKFHSLGGREERLFAANTAGVRDKGPRSQVDLGHVPKDFRDLIRGFHDLLSQKPPPLLII